MPNSTNCYLCKCSSLLLSLDRDVRGKALWDISIICFILIQIFHYRRKLWSFHNQRMFRWSVIIEVVKKKKKIKNIKKKTPLVFVWHQSWPYIGLSVLLPGFEITLVSYKQWKTRLLTLTWVIRRVCVFFVFLFVFFTVINHVKLDTLVSTNSWRPFRINVLKKQSKTKTKRLNDPGQTPSSSVFRLLLYISRQLARCGYYSVRKLSKDLWW